MAGNAVQVSAGGAVEVSADGHVIVAGDGDPCCCAAPCYRRARICSVSSPSISDTVANDVMTCADAAAIGGAVWFDGTNCVYFLSTDTPISSIPGGCTLYSAATVPIYPDCATCGSAPSNTCKHCGTCCFGSLSVINSKALLSAVVATTDVTIVSSIGMSGADIAAFKTNLVPIINAFYNATTLALRAADGLTDIRWSFIVPAGIPQPDGSSWQPSVAIVRDCPTNKWAYGNLNLQAINIPGDAGGVYNTVTNTTLGTMSVAGTCCGAEFDVAAGANTMTGTYSNGAKSLVWSINIPFTVFLWVTKNYCCYNTLTNDCTSKVHDQCPTALSDGNCLDAP